MISSLLSWWLIYQMLLMITLESCTANTRQNVTGDIMWGLPIAVVMMVAMHDA